MTAITRISDRCPGCGARVPAGRLARNLLVCPECGHHRPVGARERIAQLADPGSFTGGDALFGRATIRSQPVVLFATEPVPDGTAGEAAEPGSADPASEAAQTAAAARLPLVAVCASGGGYAERARLSKAYDRLREDGVLTVCVLTGPLPAADDPVAALSDLLVAESGVPATRQPLPGGLGPAESLLHHGRVDRVESRAGLRPLLGRLLAMHHTPAAGPARPGGRGPEPATPPRLTALDYLASAFDGFVELHGDRRHADDRAIVGGLARLAGRPVVVVAHVPGPAGPDGYHKAARLFAHAERFGLPVVTLTGAPDTRPEAAEAVLCSIWARVPIVSVVLGDGRDAGPVDLGVADAVVAEPPGGADALRQTLTSTLRQVTGIDRDALLAARHDRFRRLGAAERPALQPAA
jgi:acetyl-CoA carboxylase carboxyl transferase subunit beta